MKKTKANSSWEPPQEKWTFKTHIIGSIKGYFNPYRPFFLKRLFGIWTKKELEKIMKQEIINDTESEYYTITKQEELRKDIIRKTEFIFWKIFTR